MKVSRLFTIDVELAEMLSNQDNQSNLINTLLKDYFAFRKPKSTEIQQKKAILSDNKKKMKQLRLEIKVFDMLDKLKIDEKLTKWILGFVNEEEIYEYVDWGPYKRAHNLTIPFANIKKAWEVIKKYEHLFEKYKN